MHRRYIAQDTIVWYSIFEPPIADTGEFVGLLWNGSNNSWTTSGVHWDRAEVRSKDLTSGWAIHGYSEKDWRVVAWSQLGIPEKALADFPIPAVGDWDDWAEQ